MRTRTLPLARLLLTAAALALTAMPAAHAHHAPSHRVLFPTRRPSAPPARRSRAWSTNWSSSTSAPAPASATTRCASPTAAISRCGGPDRRSSPPAFR